MVTPDTWNRFVDDASPLGEGPEGARRRASPSRGDRLVRDEDLPRLGDYRGDVRLVVTGGAGQLAGPAAYCREHRIEVSALDLAVRDLDDPAGNVRRFLASYDAAVAAGDLLEDTVVHVRVAGDLTLTWVAALDLIAEAEWVVALPLDSEPWVDPEPWIDAAMDRETPVSLVGGSAEQAVAALTTAARLWGYEGDLSRARRWVHSWASTDADAALDHLQGLA
ncbi:hypothetical protein BH09ACT12_BH09ACT12_26190 [soil metagenome]